MSRDRWPAQVYTGFFVNFMDEVLKYAVECAMIDVSYVQELLDMTKQKEINGTILLDNDLYVIQAVERRRDFAGQIPPEKIKQATKTHVLITCLITFKI